jgi:hypothetical protein
MYLEYKMERDDKHACPDRGATGLAVVTSQDERAGDRAEICRAISTDNRWTIAE